MPKTAISAALASLVFLASCQPPPPVPPPNFRPNPPYAPTPVPPYGQDPAPTPPPAPAPTAPTAPGTYPLATATENPMQVISPYPPYNVIDLSDLPDPGSGQLARDPSNQKIFRIP
ncbi:MAG: hypothetical protein V4640_06970 [Verrucomicrobiota bacterium]